MELDEPVYAQVQELSERGNQFLDRGKYDEAIRAFQDAIELLPTPWFQWEAATWLYAALGDAYFQKGDFAAARDAFLDGLNCPDALSNPFYHLRLGEAFLELGILDRAGDALMRAYMLEGDAIFDGEPRKYIDFAERQKKRN